jgi:small subunit ribosomal protein S4e
MGKSHLKRIVMPKSWPIHRKENVWVTTPESATHSYRGAISINTIVKEMIKCANTTKEVKHMLNEGKIKIDGIVRKSHKFPVGLMDTITIEGLEKSFRFLINKKGKFFLQEISKTEANVKPRKIINKTAIKGNKLQFNLFDGVNIINKSKYDVRDTLVFSLKDNKISSHIPFEKGTLVYITSGNKVGEIGIIKEILISEGSIPTQIVCTKEKEEFKTRIEHAFAIGKTKPIITLPK